MPLADENGAITSDFADRDCFRAAWTGDDADDYDFSADAAQLAWVSAIKDQGADQAHDEDAETGAS
ncbi:MAG: hypothetical protein ACRDT7_12870 [Microbacterium sp.]